MEDAPWDPTGLPMGLHTELMRTHGKYCGTPYRKSHMKKRVRCTMENIGKYPEKSHTKIGIDKNGDRECKEVAP